MGDEELSRRSVLGGLVATGAALASGWSLTACTPAGYIPTTDATWATVDPASLGWDPAKLAEALDFAGSRASKQVLILADGKILAERLWGVASTWTNDVASVQKSVMSLLVAIAVDKGLLAKSDTVTSRLGAGWSNATTAQEAPITVQHLLTMTSGLSDGLGYSSPPGTVWRYNSNAFYVLAKIVAAVTGQTVDQVAKAWVFTPIGTSRTNWGPRGPQVDPKGDPVLGLSTNARDLARVGLVVQRDGCWGSKRLMTGSLLTSALTTSQPMNPSYGLLWWLNGKSGHIFPTGGTTQVPGAIFPSAPADLVCGLGLNDQKVYVSRSRKLVVTRLGDRASSNPVGDVGDFDDLFWAKLMAAAPAPT